MQLSQKNINNIKAQPGLMIPDVKLFTLPEKVLQFGTGVLLRGLPDYFIDKANRNGIFNGRIVVVKSTNTGGADAFAAQDGLYTLIVKGIENGEPVHENIINASISRVLSAQDEWQKILDCASNPDMQVIISNTTEVGITRGDDKISDTPPRTFPGKLLAFLYERFKVFNGSASSGMVIVPTELIPANGTLLRSIVLDMARDNKLEKDFLDWLQEHNHFCNSLVDRIVPGPLSAEEKINTEKALGYQDDLMIMSESFRLWAIESGDASVKAKLSFAEADAGVVIAPDINKFRELKLRLLNGTHTFSCGLAFLAGFDTVKEAMQDAAFSAFIEKLMTEEIAPALLSVGITREEACSFAAKVLDRFRNPSLEHHWLSITMQYSSKMKMRNLPLLERHYKNNSEVPKLMSLGFAAYILFMKNHDQNGHATGERNGITYAVRDDQAPWFASAWEAAGEKDIASVVLGHSGYWETNLSHYPGFLEAVRLNLHTLQTEGARAVLNGIGQQAFSQQV